MELFQLINVSNTAHLPGNTPISLSDWVRWWKVECGVGGKWSVCGKGRVSGKWRVSRRCRLHGRLYSLLKTFSYTDQSFTEVCYPELFVDLEVPPNMGILGGSSWCLSVLAVLLYMQNHASLAKISSTSFSNCLAFQNSLGPIAVISVMRLSASWCHFR